LTNLGFELWPASRKAPEEEIVLGETGQVLATHRQTCNLNRADFDRPVPAGFARGVWNFIIVDDDKSRTMLRTRALSVDAISLRKFLLQLG